MKSEYLERKTEFLEKPTILPTARRILQEKQKIQSVENLETQSRESTKTTPTNTIEKLPNSESEMKTHVCKVSTNPQCGQEPTNTIEDSLTKTRGNENKQNSNTHQILNNHESGNEQKIDTRLIINAKSTRTVKDFTNIIREYNTYGGRTMHETGAYIINAIEYRYNTCKAYQSMVSATKAKSNFSITSADLTPAYTPADSLGSTHGQPYNINAVKLQSTSNRKSVRVKFRIKKLNKRVNTNNEDGNEIFSKNEQAQYTTEINAQGDTGANCSATDTIDIIWLSVC